MLFRFYDPAVLRAYLVTCRPEELRAFFGPVHAFLAEGYCELPHVNRPYEIYCWGLRANDGRPQLEGLYYDGREKTFRELAPLDAAHAKPKRSSSPYFMIRQEQSNVFREFRRAVFGEGIVDKVVSVLRSERIDVTHEALSPVVGRFIEEAKNSGIAGEAALTSHVIHRLLTNLHPHWPS